MKKFIYRKILLPFVFKICAINPVRENKVLFADFRRKEMPTNFVGIYNELDKMNYKIVTLLCEDYQGSLLKRKFKKLFADFRFLKHYATSSVVFLDDYYPTIYVQQPRKETKVVQLWHACGAFKKFGYSTMDKSWGINRKVLEKYPIHNTYTHVMVSSKYIIDKYADAFNMSTKNIYAYGVPRTDIFFDDKYKNLTKIKLNSMYPHIVNKKTILYAPTYRGTSLTNSFTNNMFDMDYLSKNLSSEYIILLKLHPLNKKSFSIPDKYKDFFIDVGDSLEIEEAMLTCDVLITDYSSLVFEYTLLDKPVIMFPYDLDEYDSERGFYYEYEELSPGPIVYSTEELVKVLLDIENTFEYDELKVYRDKFMSACDGNSTERIIEKIVLEK